MSIKINNNFKLLSDIDSSSDDLVNGWVHFYLCDFWLLTVSWQICFRHHWELKKIHYIRIVDKLVIYFVTWKLEKQEEKLRKRKVHSKTKKNNTSSPCVVPKPYESTKEMADWQSQSPFTIMAHFLKVNSEAANLPSLFVSWNIISLGTLRRWVNDDGTLILRSAILSCDWHEMQLPGFYLFCIMMNSVHAGVFIVSSDD